MGAGIQAEQRSYEFNTPSLGGGLGGYGGQMVVHVAVLVHNRDREPAVQIAVELNQQFEHDRQERAELIADGELDRLALEAGPPPDGSQ